MHRLFKIIINYFNDLFYYIRRNKKIYFYKTFDNWEDAKKISSGYDDKNILKKVVYATNLLLSGKAVYERDGVILKQNEFFGETVSIILRASIENQNECKVIDFGGSLGSTYYNNRCFFKKIKKLNWTVVEQKNFVKVGNKSFSNNILNFCETFDEAIKDSKRPNVIILSGSIQYMQNPYKLLKKIIETKADYLIINRTPFIIKGKSKITIQKIPKTIIHSSYPIWLFNEIEFKTNFKKKYEEVVTFDSLEGILGFGKLKAHYKGIIYKRIKGS